MNIILQVGYRLADRILDIKKELKVGLDLGCGRGYVAKNISNVSILMMCKTLFELFILIKSSLFFFYQKVITLI